jgi:hypothetical protein
MTFWIIVALAIIGFALYSIGEAVESGRLQSPHRPSVQDIMREHLWEEHQAALRKDAVLDAINNVETHPHGDPLPLIRTPRPGARPRKRRR